jgi:hypothetical protein
MAQGGTVITEALLQEMVAAAAQEVQPEAIILFGSHATGQARPDVEISFRQEESVLSSSSAGYEACASRNLCTRVEGCAAHRA